LISEEVQLLAFDALALDGDDLRPLPLSLHKANLTRLLARRPDGIFVSPFEPGENGPVVKNRKHPAMDRVTASFR
jgi:ATP-dependent DNA ligase